MIVPEMANAVRSVAVGERVRVITDVSAVVREVHAFAHLSGNVVRDVKESRIVTVDMERSAEEPRVFQPILGSARASGPCWCWC